MYMQGGREVKNICDNRGLIIRAELQIRPVTHLIEICNWRKLSQLSRQPFLNRCFPFIALRSEVLFDLL